MSENGSRSSKWLIVIGLLLLITSIVFLPRDEGLPHATPTPSASPAQTLSPASPEPSLPYVPAPAYSLPIPTPEPTPTPTPYVPDWSWLGSPREAYRYRIVWEPTEFDSDRPLDLLKIQEMPQESRIRMEGIIAKWAALYPPEYFNRYVGDILCYHSIQVPVLDDENRMVYGKDGKLVYETLYGATSGAVIIVTDRFSNDDEILRALVHEMAHMEWNKTDPTSPHKTALESAFRTANASFVYWYEREGIRSTADISGWRSTDRKADWREGWARRYGSLSFDEDMATVTEKVVMGRMSEFTEYAVLYEKMQAILTYRAALHADFTEEFFLQILPETLAKK